MWSRTDRERTVHTVYVQYFWQEITKYTDIYGGYIRFWPTLQIQTFTVDIYDSGQPYALCIFWMLCVCCVFLILYVLRVSCVLCVSCALCVACSVCVYPGCCVCPVCCVCCVSSVCCVYPRYRVHPGCNVVCVCMCVCCVCVLCVMCGLATTTTCHVLHITFRVGQNRIYTPYMTVYLVIPCQKHRMYTVYKWFWPTLCIHICIWPSSSRYASSHYVYLGLARIVYIHRV